MIFNDEDYDKIIAIRFGGLIVFGQEALDRMVKEQDYDQLISLAEFKLMARCDLGEKWKLYADNAPVLFKFPKDIDSRERVRRPIFKRM